MLLTITATLLGTVEPAFAVQINVSTECILILHNFFIWPQP